MAETAPPAEHRIARQHLQAARSARRAVEHVPAELEHCDRCREDTDHYYVYWYTSRHNYMEPLRPIDGSSEIRTILSRVFVIWCAKHKGPPPSSYTDKPIPLGAWRQRNQTPDGGKPDYEDATS